MTCLLCLFQESRPLLRRSKQMANVNEKDVDSGGGEDVTNFRIRTKLLSTCSGAGVNAASSVNLLAFATTDHPLSELVWSPHTGLSLKCANRGDDAKKPFLLWNVGPSSMERGNGDDHDLIIDKELVAPSHGESISIAPTISRVII